MYIYVNMRRVNGFIWCHKVLEFIRIMLKIFAIFVICNLYIRN